MGEIEIPELTLEQLEELCEMAGANARECFLSKVPSSRVFTLHVSVDGDDAKPLTLNIAVEVVLSSLMKNFDVTELAEDATERAFTSVEVYLRKLLCKSMR